MRRFGSLWVVTAALGTFVSVVQPALRAEDIATRYTEPASRIIGEALGTRAAWQRLSVLTDTIGHRLSGSPALDEAINWAIAEMKQDGLERVRTEPVMVPRWVRGAESAEIVRPGRHALVMLGLGGSIGTPREGIEAEVLMVSSFDDLEARRMDAPGRIVVFNAPFTNYPQTVEYRSWGAVRAARHGAVAALVRSIGPRGFRTPHTGSMRYASEAPQIPAAAITVEDAERLQRLYDGGHRPVVRLKMEARTEPDVPSANVIAELVGSEKPDEVVVMGGHLDSWDVGTGASDDGGGCVATWEALRILKKLNLRPRRTIRVVLWTNEENGTRGGLAYRDQHLHELKDHVVMIESDTGVFRPFGFGFTRHEPGPGHGHRGRPPAARHRCRSHRPQWRRRGHRAQRARRWHPGHVARRRHIRVLPHSSHGRRYHRQDRSARPVARGCGAWRHGLRDRRPADSARRVIVDLSDIPR